MPSTYYIALRRSMPPVAAPLGDLTFTAPADHASITDYTARVYAQGTVTPILATQDLGKPTPVGGVITVNLYATLTALGAGNYDVTILTTSAGGSTESDASNAFTVPLTPA